MPKRISLEDPSSPEVDASIAKADTSDIIGLLEKIDGSSGNFIRLASESKST